MMKTDDLGVVFLRRDVIEAGHSDRYIAQRVRSGEWVRIRQGAYVPGELWRTLDAGTQHRLRARAVLRTAAADSILSHTSALLEHGAPVWDHDLSHVHLTRRSQQGGRREAGVCQHRGALTDSDVIEQGGVRVVTAARAAAEFVTIASIESALVSANALLHAGLMDPRQFEAELSRVQHWSGSLGCHIVPRLADARIESVAESRFVYLCWRHHLPRPTPQVEVWDEDGRFVGRVDFALELFGVFVEIDGRAKYRDFRRPGESLEDFLMREKRREELICQLTGWVCIRLTWSDLDNARRTASRIRAMLKRRGEAKPH